MFYYIISKTDNYNSLYVKTYKKASKIILSKNVCAIKNIFNFTDL